MGFYSRRRRPHGGLSSGGTPTPLQGTMELSITSVAFAVTEGSAPTFGQPISVRNIGLGSFTGISAVVSYVNGSGWLSVALVDVGEYRIDVDHTLGPLAPGTYVGAVTFTAGNSSNGPLACDVTMVVAAAPVLHAVMQFQASAVTFDLVAGQTATNPPDQGTAIINVGPLGTQLDNPTVVGITYSAGSDYLAASVTNNFLTAFPSGAGLPLLSPGGYLARVEVADGDSAVAHVIWDVPFQVTAPNPLPILSLNPAGPSPFNASTGGANPAAQAIAITNGGVGTLADCSAGTIVYSADSGWLDVQFTGTGNSQTMTLTCLTGALTAATRTATFPVISSGATNSGTQIQVTFTVAAAAAMIVFTAPAPFTATENGANPASQVINITNGGGGTLATCTNSTLSYSGGGGGWLGVVFGGSGNAQTMTLSATTASRPIGTHNVNFNVLSAGAASVAVAIPFTIQAPAPPPSPTMTLNPTGPQPFAATTGGSNPASQAITITNTVVGTTLPACSATTPTYTGGSPGWLTVSFTGSGNSQTMTLACATGSLTAATRSADFNILCVGATNTNLPISVTFSVTDPLVPIITLNPPQPSQFTATVGGANPSTQIIQITNGGTGTLATCTNTTIAYGGGGTGWLGVVFGGSGNAQTMTLTCTTGSLPAATRTASFSIQSTGATDVGVSVTFVVNQPIQPPSISTSPPLQSFQGTVGGSNPASQQINITNGGGSTLATCTNSSVTYGGGGTGWLGIVFGGSGNAQTMTLTCTTGVLTAATRTADFTIESAGAVNDHLAVHVVFILSAAPPGSFPAIPSNLPVGLTHSTITDLITGTLTGLDEKPFSYYTGTVRTATTSAQVMSMYAASADKDIVRIAKGAVINFTNTSAYVFDSSGRGNAGSVLICPVDYENNFTDGVRINNTTDLANLATLNQQLLSSSTGITFYMNDGGQGLDFRGIAFTRSGPASAKQDLAMVHFKAANPSGLADLVKHCEMHHCYVFNDEAPGYIVRRGVQMCAQYGVIRDSWIQGFYNPGGDSQGIHIEHTPGVIRIENNYISGETENILLGASAGAIGSTGVVADIIIKNNYIQKSLTLHQQYGSFSGGAKNFLETKRGKRVLFEGNVCDNHWGDGGQWSDVVLLPGSPVNEPWCELTDVVVRYNKFTRGFGALNPGTALNQKTPVNQVLPVQRLTVTDNLWLRSRASLSPNNAGENRVEIGVHNQVGRGAMLNLTISRNTFCCASNGGSWIYVGTQDGDGYPGRVAGLTIHDNLNLGNLDVSPIASQSGAVASAGLLTGTDLDYGCGVGQWSIKGNVQYKAGAPNDAAGWGAPLATGAAGTRNYSSSTPIACVDPHAPADDCTLTDSRFTNKSTTGGSPGVNMVRLNSMILGVIEGHPGTA